MDGPFSDVRLGLKQVDMAAVSEPARSLFTAVLGSYGLNLADEEVAEGLARLSREMGGVKLEFESGGRRFAGDRSLPRTRYFSVTDGLGMDQHTLLLEMSTYLLNSTYPGLITLFDSDGMQNLEFLGNLADIPRSNYQTLDFTRPSLLMAIRPLAAEPVLIDAYGEGAQYVVQIPYRLSYRTVKGAIDLRDPAAREWLVAEFGGSIRLGDKDFPLLLYRERPTSFEQILPSLLDQWLGGGWTTGNLAGYIARRSGASGLVYPSARSNASVEVRDGVVDSSAGWCYVSYEGAPAMEVAAQFSKASDPWPTQIGWSPQPVGPPDELIPLKGTNIEYIRSGPLAESFVVHGLAEYNHALYRLSQIKPVFRAIDQELGAHVSSRLSYMASFRTAEDVEWICLVLRNALLGDARSLAELEVRTSSADSDYERETYAEAQQLISRAPTGFRATGSLAASLRFY